MSNESPSAEAAEVEAAAAAEAALMAEQMADQVAAQTVTPVMPQPVQAVGDINIDVILDVPVTLSLEVGRTRLPIRSLLQLNQGSVVELERAAGEPLDVFVNGTLVAHGEVVVVNEKFGIRLVDVISPAERIRKLK
jgi:flagellar motor switch protein FliN